jgi:DNA-binding NarL/FixJ family response regulator
MLRILLADDHAIVRNGLRNLIESHPGWEVCGEAADGQSALEIALRERPDIAVLDVNMPGLDGVELARRLHSECPSVRVLLFTTHGDDATVDRGLAAGARGYVLKTDSERHLVDAIAALAANRPYFSSLVAERAQAAIASQHRPSPPPGFTARELDVARLIAEGNSNKQIARRLSIGVKTVESHRAAAMRKAGVHTAAELVRFAIRRNLIQP